MLHSPLGAGEGVKAIVKEVVVCVGRDFQTAFHFCSTAFEQAGAVGKAVFEPGLQAFCTVAAGCIETRWRFRFGKPVS